MRLAIQISTCVRRALLPVRLGLINEAQGS
jgi:hypothetical protein